MTIAPIQRLRAVAALAVIIGHAQTESLVAASRAGLGFAPSALLPWGAGVDLFFVISGFIMVVSTERLFARPGGAATFAARRIVRIVPLYWLFTTLYVAIQFATRKPVGGADVLASYLFWPRDTFGDGIARPVFTLGWTLNYEMFFYALFAAALVLPARRAVAAVTVALAAGVAVGRLAALPPGPLGFWTQPIVVEFALGMGLGLAWREGLRLAAPARLALGAAALLLLRLDLMDAAHRPSDWITPTDFVRVLGWGVPAALAVAAAALGDARQASSLRPSTAQTLAVQPWAFLDALGDASYALYLVHPFVVGTLMRAWTLAGLGGRLGYWPFVALSLALSVAAAFLTRRRFEVPVARALRRPARGPILAAS